MTKNKLKRQYLSEWLPNGVNSTDLAVEEAALLEDLRANTPIVWFESELEDVYSRAMKDPEVNWTLGVKNSAWPVDAEEYKPTDLVMRVGDVEWRREYVRRLASLSPHHAVVKYVSIDALSGLVGDIKMPSFMLRPWSWDFSQLMRKYKSAWSFTRLGVRSHVTNSALFQRLEQECR